LCASISAASSLSRSRNFIKIYCTKGIAMYEKELDALLPRCFEMYDLMAKIPTMGKKKASKQLIVYENLQQLADRVELIVEHLDNLEVLTQVEFYS
jgi:hypothetical protein